MNKLLAAAIPFAFIFGLSSQANALVNLQMVADYGTYVVAHGVSDSPYVQNCNMVESRTNWLGYTQTQVIGNWIFAPYSTRVFNLPKNGSYFNLVCN
ncbi:hypothetical protein BS636_13745 [Acinetobacter sp. LoGeW2-3]|uniref:hypothetical protein n=1 Tax=Acinetobacter sp. LoGeW2-3 TaxID=1808001 RepID=UPI000C05A81E|nr:hypothetical protein [Acinetobacter sp. LoGeW2-3]ATO20661.1 hypothetical protein BS636_13745 [Acinetobacter sp. LoGeW2-3]